MGRHKAWVSSSEKQNPRHHKFPLGIFSKARNIDLSYCRPYCPQPPRDFYPVPSPARPWLEIPETDEFNCLNLNISVPKRPEQQMNPLPVMVFIHGGAFTYAANSAPIYDGRILAAASAEKFSNPTIIITVNYRLGVYGFLAGTDLLEYNSASGESGVGNYGLWDQVLALRWIQRHISAFGGDPNKVTLFGQSAGATSAHAHLLRDEPLFSSAILQSGLIRLCGYMTIDEHQAVYERLLSALDIPLDLSPKERVKRLMTVDTSVLTQAMVPTYIIPVITSSLCDDGVLVSGPAPTYSQYGEFPTRDWCPRIMMGDAKNECIIWNKSWDNISEKRLAPNEDLTVPTAQLTLAKMESFLGAAKARQIADLYGITPDTTNKDLFVALERLTTHGLYTAPIYFAQKAAQTSVFAYHFDVPSPFDNAWGGFAHHSFDNVLIWGILRHTLPASLFNVADSMTEAWIKFSAGRDPWEKLSEKGKYMVFGPEGAAMKSRQEYDGRDYKILDRLHELDLVPDLANLSDELCIRRSELIAGPQ